MIRPLIQNGKLGSVRKVGDAVFGYDRQSKARNKLLDTVVYFGVDVVGTSRKNDYRHFALPRLFDYLLALCDKVAAVVFESLHSLAPNRFRVLFGNAVFCQRLAHYLGKMLFKIYVNVRMHEIVVVKLVNVGFKQFGIVRHNGTVIVIVALTLVDIVAFAGVENEIRAPLQKAEDVSVGKLRGIAYRVRGNGVLTLIVDVTGAFLADHHLKAKFGENLVPERQLLVKSQTKGKSHLCFGGSGLVLQNA